MVEVIKLSFNLPIIDNYTCLGAFTTKKKAINYMKKITIEYNYRDRNDRWNVPLIDFKDYRFCTVTIPINEYKQLKKEGK